MKDQEDRRAEREAAKEKARVEKEQRKKDQEGLQESRRIAKRRREQEGERRKRRKLFVDHILCVASSFRTQECWQPTDAATACLRADGSGASSSRRKKHGKKASLRFCASIVSELVEVSMSDMSYREER